MPANKPNIKPASTDQALDMEAILAKAKAEAEAKATSEAERIIAEAKAEADKIVAEAKNSDNGLVVSSKVTAKDLTDAYISGLSHLAIAKKFYGSASDENVEKVSAIINKKFGIEDGIDPNVRDFEPGELLEG